MIASRYSFRLLSKEKNRTIHPDHKIEATKAPDAESDSKKRSFLKLAGVVGVGAAATYLMPKKAEALVFGSTPTSNVVGIRNASNVKINPATEDSLAGVKAKTDLLTFDAGASPANLKVNIAAGDVGIQNASNVTINPATEDGNLATIATNTNKLTALNFDGSGNLLTAAVGGGASVVGIKDTTNTQVNPATDDSVIYLRRIVKLMESQAVVDAASRQRVNVDSFGTNTALLTGTGTGAGTPRFTVASDSSLASVAALTNIISVAGQNQQMYQDVARNTYANSIRQNLAFS